MFGDEIARVRSCEIDGGAMMEAYMRGKRLRTPRRSSHTFIILMRPHLTLPELATCAGARGDVPFLKTSNYGNISQTYEQ